MLVIAVTLNAYVLFFVVPTEDVALGASFANATEDTGINRFQVEGSVLTGYLHFLGELAHGDLGQSWRTREDVTEIIGRAAPATASLVIGGAILWIGLALVIGVVSAMRPRSLFDRAGMVFVLLGIAAQPLWLGYVLAYVFGYRLQLVPDRRLLRRDPPPGRRRVRRARCSGPTTCSCRGSPSRSRSRRCTRA